MSSPAADAAMRGDEKNTTTSSSPDVEKQEPFFNEQTNYVPTKQILMVGEVNTSPWVGLTAQQVFIASAVVEFVALVDQNTLATALPNVASYLSAGSQQAWISSAYFVTTTSFTLTFGRLSDIWSRKTVLLGGLAIFFVGSLASSLAQTATQLIIFRAITGVGGGGLATVAQAIVSDVVPLRERGKWQGILGAGVALAHAVGPVVGGAFSQLGGDGWRWIFRLNLPLSALSLGCILFMMPLRKVQGDWVAKLKAIDWLGIVLSLAASTLAVLGFTWAGGSTPGILALSLGP